MKTKKLWIWSFILALLATIVLYFIITVNFNQRTVKTDTPAAADSQSKGNTGQTSQTGTTQQTTQDTTNTSTNEEKVETILPIGDGKRAMSIQVSDVQGISGYIKQGSHVDVVANLVVPADAKPGQYPAQTFVIQNTKVLALGHAADDDQTKKRYQLVTLEVNPTEALTLGFASKYEFYLLLRKDGDEKLEPANTHIYENQLHEGVFQK